MRDEIRKTLMSYVVQGKLHEQVMLELDVKFKEMFDSWVETKTSKLKEMVKSWEDSVGEEDNSLYSLGLRRAVDVLTDTDPFQQLPILEKPDTPDEA